MQGEITVKRLSVGTVGLLVIAFAFIGCANLPFSQSDPGWITLFDGHNLNSWTAVGNANWRLADGIVQAELGNGSLVSKNAYKDFELRAEFWVDAEANSGIFLRCADPKKVGPDSCYEVNIYDQRPEPSYGTGAIVGVAKV